MKIILIILVVYLIYSLPIALCWSREDIELFRKPGTLVNFLLWYLGWPVLMLIISITLLIQNQKENDI